MSDSGTWAPLVCEGTPGETPLRAFLNGVPIWVVRGVNGLRGFQDTCPHEARSLGTARLAGGGGMVRCFYHNYTFKLANGAGVNCPGFHLTIYDVREEGGSLYAAEIPA